MLDAVWPGPVTGSAVTLEAGAAPFGPDGAGIATTVDAVCDAGAASGAWALARLTVTLAVAVAVAGVDGTGCVVDDVTQLQLFDG